MAVAEVLKDAWLWILLAFLVGALVGYFMRGKSADNTADAARISQLEADLAQCRAGKGSAAPVAASATATSVAAQPEAVPAATEPATVAEQKSAAVATANGAAGKAPAKASAAKTTPAKTTPVKAVSQAPAAKTPATKKPATKAPAAATKPAAKPTAALDLAAAAAALGFKIKADDLTVIEGIGPKIAGLLKADGISTWAQLGDAKVADLRAILEKAGPRYNVHEPATWPKQAKLLAGGKWAQFAKLTDELKGGRAV